MASRLTLRHVFRHYSTILSSNTSTNPERILEICRSTSLTMDCRQDYNVLSFADAKLYGHANMLPHALRTFNHMRDELQITPSVKSLNALLLASIVTKDYKEVTRIYLEFPKMYSIQPNVDTYNLVIKSFAESGSTSSVFSIFDEMDMNSIEPNEVTFNNAIAGFYNVKKFDDVGKLMNLMGERYKMYPFLNTYILLG